MPNANKENLGFYVFNGISFYFLNSTPDEKISISYNIISVNNIFVSIIFSINVE